MKVDRSELASAGLAALAVASVLAVLATRHAPTTEERDARAKRLLPVWREDDVTRVELEGSGATFTLERAPEGFRVRTPELEPADTAAVHKLLGALAMAAPLRTLDPSDAHGHGLDRPRARLKIAMGSEALVLGLGDVAPTPPGAAYVAATTGGVTRASVVSRDVAALFGEHADDFRDRTLVTLGVREIAELTLDRPGGELRLVRGPILAFHLDGKERANREACEPLFSALGHLGATRFLTVPAALAARGPTPPVTLTLTPRPPATPGAEPARRTVLEIGGACPDAPNELIAIVKQPQPRAACVEKRVLDPLAVSRDALLDTQPFSARKDEVEALTLERGGKRLVLERRGTAFLLREPSEAPVELDAGNRRIEAIAHAPAELVAQPNRAALGLSPPSGRAVLRVIGDDDKAVEEELELGKTAPDGTLYAERKEDHAVLALGREAARAFAVDSTLLRSQKVLDFALSTLAELELSAPEPELLRRAPAGFELVRPSGFQADGELATGAVLALGSLTASRWVADVDDASFGFETPTLTVRARIDGTDAGSAEHGLVVGRPTSGGYFAELRGSPGVFLVERGVVERLDTLLVDRSPFMADPATLARVTLSAKGKEVVLERRGGELAPRSADIDRAGAEEALEALAGLRATAALHTGPARANEGLGTPWLRVRIEPSPGLGKARAFSVGESSEFRGESVRYGRVDGVDATFALSEAKLRPVFELF